MGTDHSRSTGPLNGIRVLDLGQAGVGPYAAGLLAQMGADVIKCEPPSGDIINRSGRGSTSDRPTSLYITTNLMKRGIVLNLKEDADRLLFLRLVATADVYMDNMKADTAEHLGIGYEVLSSVNPQLVWVNSSGFGAKGPLKEMGSFEQYSDAFAGVSSVTGERHGRPERLSQLRVDPFTSCCLVTMVLAGLVARVMCGRGQKVLGSQFESSLQLGMVRSFEALNLPNLPRPMGTEHPHIVPSSLFPARDGLVAISAVTEQNWRDLCVAIGSVDWIFDPRFATNARRVEHRDEIHVMLASALQRQSVSHWVRILQARGVPAAPLLAPVDVSRDAHVRFTAMLQSVPTHWGPVTVPGTPARFGLTPTRLGPGPLRGEHTEEVFAELESGGTSS
jgi:crotonobetainyl-CoA:carnitine CoA-transferase CaiB-like acyl-CoA transferase